MIPQFHKFNTAFLALRAFSLGVPNAKYLAFGTPNTKNRASSGMLNVSKFWYMLQYTLKYESVWTEMPFWFNIFLFSFLSPLSSLYSFIFSLCHSLFLSSQSSLLKISLIFDQDLSPPHLVINLHNPHR